MNKFKAVVQALTGYIGSSESAEKISARFVGLSMGTITFLAPFVAARIGVSTETLIAQVQPIGYMVAIAWYIYGAVKACWLAAKASPTLGAFFRKE